MKKIKTESQVIRWLQKNQSKINISEFAKAIDLDISNLHKAISRAPLRSTNKGAFHKIPPRCMDASIAYITSFSEIPTIEEAQL